MALKQFRQAGIPLGVIGLAILIAVWMVASRPKALPKPPEERVWPVSVVAVEFGDYRPQLSAFGEVQAVREAEIRAMVDGRLIYLNPDFKDGNRVTAGTELATIDTGDYENRVAEQRAELARLAAALTEQRRELEWEQRLEKNADAQVALSTRALERSDKLAATGRESQKQRDEVAQSLVGSEQILLQRQQTIARLRARISQQQAAYEKTQAVLAQAERDLSKTRIVAPFDGYVTGVRLALGKVIGIGESLGRLLAADELEVRFELAESHYARLIDGDDAGIIDTPVTVTWRLGDVAEQFGGHLTRIGAEIDPTVGGIELFAQLGEDASSRGLRAGAFVELTMPGRMYNNVLRIPARALTDDRAVYALRDGRLARIEVDVVRELGAEVLVRGELKDGDYIVARAFSGIGPGLRARSL